jgi:bacteriocin-like protein
MRTLTDKELRHVAGGSNANFPPGQMPSGNPAKAPGNSSTNENRGPKD